MRRLVDRMLESPVVYAILQAPFVSRKFAPVERALADFHVRRVLDVGCGPGTNAPRFAAAEYVGVDINDRYLQIARNKYGGRFVQADLTVSDLASFGRFDTILVNSFLHHLPDDAVRRILRQLEQLVDTDGRVHLLELVLPEQPSIARLMARLDRGRFARPLAAWRHLFESHFAPVVVEPYSFAAGLWSMIYYQGRKR